MGVFRAYDAIREVTQAPEAKLTMPDLVRTSNMRKYMTTMLQALNTTEAERQWVLDHMGHTMNVHKVHYRQTSDVLERVDVAKVLLIQDLGLVGKYQGKRIQDIQIEDLFGGDELERPSEMPEAQELITVMTDIVESEDEVPELREDNTDEESVEFRPKRKKPQKVTDKNGQTKRWQN